MRFKAVGFDLDDTLVKTAEIKWRHHKAVAKQFYNIDLTDDILARYWGLPLNELMSKLYQDSDTFENMLAANRSLEHLFLKELQEGALPIVESLLEIQVAVGIVTATLRVFAVADLTRLGFPTDRFAFIQAADDTPVHKPNPAVFDPMLALLEGRGIARDEVLYVGDALTDYYAARDAGLQFVGITTGFVSGVQFEAEGARWVSNLTELAETVLIYISTK